MRSLDTHASLVLLCVAACGVNQTHPSPATYDPGAPEALDCVPNLDGVLDATELAPVLDVPVGFLVSPNGTEPSVDVRGATDTAGRRVWDWSVAGASDELFELRARDVASAWYAAEFPNADFVASLDAGGENEGVYAHDDAGLYLLGVASAQEQPSTGQTLIKYDPPVTLYSFPLEPGATWSTTSTVRDATVRGLPYAAIDTYEAEADGAGVFELPDLTLTQAHRVRLTTTFDPAIGDPFVERRAVFLFECLGEVARATSRTDEPTDDFTTAAEARRLSLAR